MDMGLLQYDPVLGWMPGIPEPFWYRGWRSFFRLRPACYHCGNPRVFRNRHEYEIHYALTHIKAVD